MFDASRLGASIPVLRPRLASSKLGNPLGKSIWIRIELEECRDLPRTETSLEGFDSRPSYCVSFLTTTHDGDGVDSSMAEEGADSLRGTVQWDEVLYLECCELGLVQIRVHSPDVRNGFGACFLVEELLEEPEILLWDESGDTSCTLCLSASQVFDEEDEQDHNVHLGSNARAQNDYVDVDSRVPHSAPTARITNSMHTILRQLALLMDAVDPLKIGIFYDDVFIIQGNVYDMYQHGLYSELLHPRVNILINTMVSTMNAILPGASTYMRRRKGCVKSIVDQLFWSAAIMEGLANQGPGANCESLLTCHLSYKNPEAELARLTLIIVTPRATTGPSSTSTNSNQRTISSTIAKDTLLFALDALAQSSDACSPLKSVAGGLMFFATWADLVSSNKEDIRDICERINSLVGYFKLVIKDGAPLTPAHQNTINALAKDITKLNGAMEDIVAERKSRLKRYFSAKQHRKKLEGIARKLDEARGNYTAAVVTLHASTTADVLAHVQAYTLLIGTSPMHAPGTHRADALTFPFNTAPVEEV